MKAAFATRAGNYSEKLVSDAAREIRETLGATAGAAVAFCGRDYLPHLSDFCEALRVDGHIINVLGCTGSGWIGGAQEQETGPGFSVLALTGAESHLPVLGISSEESESENPRSLLPDYRQINGWVALANPFTFDAESWLANWTTPKVPLPVVGGFASGGQSDEDTAVFINGKTVDCAVLGVGGSLRLVPLLSQGCRPIGEPLTVTRAENNVVYALGSRPAYEALESAFETLSDKEKAGARGNLFAGLAGTEYVEDFRPSDFLVRNILGADPSSGAVVIGGIPRVGQTLQYQLRDAASADLELTAVLKRTVSEWGSPLASLVFACSGRGQALFGGEGHDATSIQKLLGTHPSAGFFCNGEIGPVGLKNCIHSFSLSCALIAGTSSH